MIKSWPVQDAKARFSEFLDACLSEGPQMVTRRGAETAVLIPITQWQQIQSAARPSLKALLSYVVFIGVLLLRPEGLFARKTRKA